MSCSKSRLTAGAVVAMALSLSGLSALAQARPFAGPVVDGGKVELRIKGDRAKGGTFMATDVPLSCDDSTLQPIDFPPLHVRFINHTEFLGRLYQRAANGDQAFFKVRGHIEGKKASGILFALADVATQSGTDCSTIPERWQASR
jgi:hypothetical protein